MCKAVALRRFVIVVGRIGHDGRSCGMQTALDSIGESHAPMTVTAFGTTCAASITRRRVRCLEGPVDADEPQGAVARIERPDEGSATTATFRAHACPDAPKTKNPRAHGFSRAFFPSSNRAESDRGAGDRTRTGKPVKAADFRHTASFKAGVADAMPFVRWTMPSPSRAGVPAARAP
ncbi:hypothetical protein L810_7595 [Burkholderia sp. AU4i]|nr:hypothetical protein L810_7595 [Burkholderia sp. AU4i]